MNKQTIMKKLFQLFKSDKFQITALSLIILFIAYIVDQTLFRYIVLFLIFILIPVGLLTWFMEKKKIKFDSGGGLLTFGAACINWIFTYSQVCEGCAFSFYFSFCVVPFLIYTIGLISSYFINNQKFTSRSVDNNVIFISIIVICASVGSIYAS